MAQKLYYIFVMISIVVCTPILFFAGFFFIVALTELNVILLLLCTGPLLGFWGLLSLINLSYQGHYLKSIFLLTIGIISVPISAVFTFLITEWYMWFYSALFFAHWNIAMLMWVKYSKKVPNRS